MRFFINSKKKVRTHKQVMNRFYFAVGLIAVMFIVSTVAAIKAKHVKPNPYIEALNERLDSVMRDGFPDIRMFEASDECYAFNVQTEEQTRLQARLIYLNTLLEMKLAPMGEKYVKESESELTEEIDSLEARINSGNTLKAYGRQVRFSLSDTARFVCLQAVSENLDSCWIQNITPLGNPAVSGEEPLREIHEIIVSE